MQLESVTAEIRPRSDWEAADLGFAMVRRDFWRCFCVWWLAMALPGAAVAVILWDHPILFFLLFWWGKPAGSRLVLFELSRRLFGEKPPWRAVWRELPRAWTRRFFHRFLWARFSPWLPVTLAVEDLEGLRGSAYRQRCVQIARRGGGVVTCLYFVADLAAGWAALGLIGTVLMLIPSGDDGFWTASMQTWDPQTPLQFPLLVTRVVVACLMLAVSLTDILVTGAGFGIYINNRTWIEGWDVELAFKRMAKRLANVALLAIAFLMLRNGVKMHPPFGPDWNSGELCSSGFMGNGRFDRGHDFPRPFRPQYGWFRIPGAEAPIIIQISPNNDFCSRETGTDDLGYPGIDPVSSGSTTRQSLSPAHRAGARDGQMSAAQRAATGSRFGRLPESRPFRPPVIVSALPGPLGRAEEWQDLRPSLRFQPFAMGITIGIDVAGCAPAKFHPGFLALSTSLLTAGARAAESMTPEEAIHEVKADKDFIVHSVTHRVPVESYSPPRSISPPTFIQGLSRIAAICGVALIIGFLGWVIWKNRHVFLIRSGGGGEGKRLPPGARVVMGMEISRDSLPPDIPARALELWRAGRRHEALALLYRGAISRAIDTARVEILESDTEGDCLRRVEAAGATAHPEYFRGLTGVWTRLAYAGVAPGDEEVSALCQTWPFGRGGAA